MARCEYSCIRKPNGDHHDSCPANPNPPEPSTRDALAEACANSFYHAQGSIEQVMPWSDCKESFQRGFDAGRASAGELVTMLKSLFCEPDGTPCFIGSVGDREYFKEVLEKWERGE